ncbi:MAG: four helix bundle protein [Alistipes sp.]|nr:four helix bundle protein [Alistipes sp.]
MKSDNLIEDKSFDFAVRIVNLYKHLQDEHCENVMSKQVLRCGTSIGANIKEAMQAQSRKDFISKMNIALKESYETEYWLRLLSRTKYITDSEFSSIFAENQSITNILAKIVITSKNTQEE